MRIVAKKRHTNSVVRTIVRKPVDVALCLLRCPRFVRGIVGIVGIVLFKDLERLALGAQNLEQFHTHWVILFPATE